MLFFGTVALLAVVTGLGTFDPDFTRQIFSPSFPLTFLSLVFPMLIAVCGEEYGWRGYMLPELSKQHGRLRATLITGLVWGAWHIPSFFLLYREAGLGNPILLTAIGVVNVAVGAFGYSYLYYRNGNILPIVLMHAVHNVVGSQVMLGSPAIAGITEAIPGVVNIHWPYAMGLSIITGSVAAVVFTKKFSQSGI